MTRDDPIRAVTRGLQVLEALNERPVSSLTALHRVTGLPKPSLVRLLETLMDAGYVARISRSEGYALTEAVLRLASGLRRCDAIVDVARPLMEAFTLRHKWQVSLSTAETDVMLVRFSTRHISPFSRERSFVNRRVPMLQSAVGRAYFAFCSPEQQAFIVNCRRALPNPLPIETNPDHLSDLVARVRTAGFATTERPRSDSTRSFAVPILEPGLADSPLGALAFFYYRPAMPPAEAICRYLSEIQALAAEIATHLTEAWPVDGQPPFRRSG